MPLTTRLNSMFEYALSPDVLLVLVPSPRHSPVYVCTGLARLERGAKTPYRVPGL